MEVGKGPRKANPKCLPQSPSYACPFRPQDLCPHLYQGMDLMTSKDPTAFLSLQYPSQSPGALPGWHEDREASVPCPQVPGPAPKYLFRAVHAIPGFMLQEVLLPKVTLPTLGTLKGFLPSMFPARRSHRGGVAERVSHLSLTQGPFWVPSKGNKCSEVTPAG